MPIVFQEQVGQNTLLALWKIDETAEELEKRLQLKPHELAVLRSFNGYKRNLHWLATRVLLRKLLNTNDYIDLQADEHGKPVLKQLPYHLSLSHSYDYAAVILSSSERVGIDIEQIKDKIVNVKHKFLVSDELNFIDQQHVVRHLYVCWCAKEALYKLNGKKETSFKDHIRLSAFPYQEQGVLSASIAYKGETKNYQVSYFLFGTYMIGYVIE